MFKARQILAALIVVLIFSGWSGLVLAAGKPCTISGVSGTPPVTVSDCPSVEQCCCCRGDGTCGAVAEKGVCFPKQVVTSIKDKNGNPIPSKIVCGDVICPFSRHISVKEFIDKAVSDIFYLSIIVAPLMIIIGAFVFLTSAGSPKQTKLGSSIIQWTAIGLAVILFAKGISAIIKMILVG